MPRKWPNRFGLGVSRDDADRLIDFVDSAVDVTKSALLQALGRAVVFLMGDVLVGLFQELLGAVQAAGMVEAGIYRRMIVQVFAVIDGSLLDFIDGLIDGVNGLFFLVTEFAAIMMFQMGARGPMRVTEIEAAKREIVATAQRLEREGTIMLPTDSADMVS